MEEMKRLFHILETLLDFVENLLKDKVRRTGDKIVSYTGGLPRCCRKYTQRSGKEKKTGVSIVSYTGGLPRCCRKYTQR